MNLFTKTNLIYLLLKISYVFGGKCGSGVKCIVLAECKGIQNGIQSGERAFLTLFRHLRCGVNSLNGDLMVCCPPEFLNALPIDNDPIGEVNLLSASAVVNLLPKECGNQYTSLLIGSSVTDFDEHSWTALIKYKKPRGHGFYCGGVLISSRYVLTAAHCVKGADMPSNWTVSQVRLGEWNISSSIDCDRVECAPPAIDVDVEETVTHSEYNPQDDHQLNDIALLRLAREVPFSEFVKPICLPNKTMENNILQGRNIETVGWGVTETKFTSDIKLKARLSVVDERDCSVIYKKAGRHITKSQLCAGGDDSRASCRGDSGGPLMVKTPPLFNWMVIGIKSYGPTPCGTTGWPGVYTRVPSYVDWIIQNMRP